MAFEYEALVGNLYVVGGRAVSVPPPGALVEVAPRRAARGRETDTFFALVLPSGDAAAPTSFFERMVQLAAERYFESTGSVTTGIKQVFASLNQDLYNHNQEPGNRPYEANMICAVLRGDDLIIGRVGAAVAILRHQDQISTVPEDLTNEEAVFDPPIGVQLAPEIKLTRHRVATSTRMIFADAHLADLPLERVTAAMGEQDMSMLLIAFKELARLTLSVLAVEFVPPDIPAPIPVPEGESTVTIAEAARASGGKQAPESLETARKRVRKPPRLLLHTQRGLGGTARTVAGGLDLGNKALDLYGQRVSGGAQPPTAETPDAPPTARKSRFSAGRRITGGIAVLIPIVFIAVVVVLWLTNAGRSEFELCMQETENLARVAREVSSASPENLLATWSATISSANLCNEMRPNDPNVAAIIREGQAIIDRINIIERREPRVMQSLEGATFSQIMLQGTDLYVLDSARSAVYHGILSQDGRSLSQRLEPILDMRQGVTVSGFQLGELVDIAFSQNLDIVFAMDKAGTVVTCRRRQKQGCEAQRLLRTETWVSPAAITVWGAEDRFYVLDPGGNQIWRYDRLGGAYSGVPTPYFDGQNQGAIQNAVDFAIGRPPSGNVFVLRADGAILQYFRAQIQEFRLVGFPSGQQPRTADGMYLDEDPLGQAIYMTTRESGTVYRFTQGGAHWATYRSTDERLFSAMSGVVSNAGQGVVYVISGNSIFWFEQ